MSELGSDKLAELHGLPFTLNEQILTGGKRLQALAEDLQEMFWLRFDRLPCNLSISVEY